MTHNTEIQWTHVPGYKGETWNPWTGCTKVSPGCAHCYIEDTPPFRKAGVRFEQGKIPITIYPERLHMPLRWKKPRAVFVNSMSDLFHEDVPDRLIAEVFAVMASAPQHIFMVLTKRPLRMAALLGPQAGRNDEWMDGWVSQYDPQRAGKATWPVPNVWLGVTIENRRMVGRADLLRQTPAAVRFISAEPLLGPLLPGKARWWGYGSPALKKAAERRNQEERKGLDLTDIDWLIVGGESGSGHRPIREEWVRDLRAACLRSQVCPRCEGFSHVCPRCHDGRDEIGTAFFFKQWGGRTPKAGGRELDGRTWDEFPVAAR